MTAERQARAQRLIPYFELQLRLARRMAELTGGPLSACVQRYTNFHRRFGLGTAVPAPNPAWAPYAAGLDALDDLAAQVAFTHETFLDMPEEPPSPPPRKRFGCFGCDAPAADGTVQIHFNNRDTDAAGGPLVRAKIPARHAELAAMVAYIGDTYPEARAIRGRSWLYNLEAYRRLFPNDYVAAAWIDPGPINLHGNSSWGQVIDSWERVRPPVAAALIERLPHVDAQAPWKVFPLPVLGATAPLGSFRALYGLGA